MSESTAVRPSTFGIAIARALWTDEELVGGVVNKKRRSGRPPLSPTRTKKFKGPFF